MKNRKIDTYGGTPVKINDHEWTDTLVNRKVFDSESTEILRVVGHPQRGLVRIYAMRSVQAKVAAEFNDIVIREANLADHISHAAEVCGLSAQIVADAISDLS